MRVSRKDNALWFFLAFFFGGAGIWWTKSAVDNAWIAAGVAAGVVLALATYYMLNDEDAPDEEGDNVYYLGLLFTLVSLMSTLVELFGGEIVGHNAKHIRILLENFGIALTSTVVGIAARIAVQNWQHTGGANKNQESESSSFTSGAIPEPPSASANIRDLEAFNRQILSRIARDLTQGANAFARFHRIVRRYASDTGDDLRDHSQRLKQESAAFKETLQRNAEIFSQEIKCQVENAIETVRVSLDATTKRAQFLLNKLQSTHDDYLSKIRETTASLHDEIRSASIQNLNVSRQHFNVTAQQVASLMQKVSATHEQISESSERIMVDLERVSSASVIFGHNTQKAAKSVVALESEADKLHAALALVHAKAGAMAGAFDATARQAELLLGKLQSTHDDYLSKVLETTGSFHNEIRSTSIQNLDALSQNFNVAVQQVVSLMQRMSATHEQISESWERIMTDLRQANAASAIFDDSTKKVAKSVAALESETDKLCAALALVNARAGENAE